MERQRLSFRGGALDGEFELFAPDEAVTARYTPRLIDRQTVNAALAPMREASLSSATEPERARVRLLARAIDRPRPRHVRRQSKHHVPDRLRLRSSFLYRNGRFCFLGRSISTFRAARSAGLVPLPSSLPDSVDELFRLPQD